MSAEERDALRALLACLEDPSEDWRQGEYTLSNRARGIDIWTSGGPMHVYRPGTIRTGLLGYSRLRRAVRIARANELRRRLGTLCLAEDVP